jgi:hypothetical protein
VQNARKILLSVLVIGALGSIVALGAFSAFSSSTTNPGNSFSAGTVAISDNDANGAMYNLTNQEPSDPKSNCIRVTYTGSLDSAVKLYTGSTLGAGAQYVDLTITPGTQGGAPAFPACTGFVASGAPIYSGTLANFASSHSSWANGLAAPGPSAANWSTADNVVYRFTTTLQDDNSAQGASSGSHDFTWEAQNS